MKKTFTEYVGFENDEIVGKRPRDIFPVEYGNTLEARYKRCVCEGIEIKIDEKIELRSGINYFQTTLTPIEVDGKITEIIVSKKDVTEQSKGIEALRNSEEKFRALTESSPDIIFTVNRNK